MRTGRNSLTPCRICVMIAWLGILFLSMVRCKSPTSPDGQGEADIIVSNDYGETVDIYMDGSFKFALRYKNSIEIDNVSLEEHELEAREPGSGKIVDSTTIDVEDKIDYAWTVDDPPDIKVINNYGKALSIYLDEEFQFDLADEESRWIIDVALGVRFLKALDTGDGHEVASTSLKVDQNADYSWTIQKIT
jgi:hypothetical protein